MRYVMLNSAGEGGLSVTDARRFVTVVKTQSGSPEDEVMMTAPDESGNYFIAFANHAHATRFIDLAPAWGSAGVADAAPGWRDYPAYAAAVFASRNRRATRGRGSRGGPPGGSD